MVYDSRKVEKDSLFLCIKGAVSDGHKYAEEVVRKGASVLVVQDPVPVPEGVTVIRVADSRYAMACISAAWFEHPAEKLKVIGITGTKGKPTTTYLVKSILENAGYKVGLIGTIEAIIGEQVIPAANTTPESYIVQEYFAKMVKAGCDCVVMEVSSQGLMLHRTAGFLFDFGIFTNIFVHFQHKIVRFCLTFLRSWFKIQRIAVTDVKRKALLFYTLSSSNITVILLMVFSGKLF